MACFFHRQSWLVKEWESHQIVQKARKEIKDFYAPGPCCVGFMCLCSSLGV